MCSLQILSRRMNKICTKNEHWYFPNCSTTMKAFKMNWFEYTSNSNLSPHGKDNCFLCYMCLILTRGTPFVEMFCPWTRHLIKRKQLMCAPIGFISTEPQLCRESERHLQHQVPWNFNKFIRDLKHKIKNFNHCSSYSVSLWVEHNQSKLKVSLCMPRRHMGKQC